LLKEIGKTNFTIGRRREKSVTAYSRNWYHCFEGAIAAFIRSPKVEIEDTAAFEAWKIKCNSAKQAGYVAIGIKVQLGDFIPIKRELAHLIKIMQQTNCVLRCVKIF
jgi:sulfite reductase (ferredoxin)